MRSNATQAEPACVVQQVLKKTGPTSQRNLAHRVLPAVKDADHIDQKPAHDNSHAKRHYCASNDVPFALLRRLGIQYAAHHEG